MASAAQRGKALDDKAPASRATKVVAQQSERLADSAQKLEQSTDRIENQADRTTQLAADRTVLAAERTYAAWTRTGLVALASGVGAKGLLAGLIPEWMVGRQCQRAGRIQHFLFRGGNLAATRVLSATAASRHAGNSSVDPRHD